MWEGSSFEYLPLGIGDIASRGHLRRWGALFVSKLPAEFHFFTTLTLLAPIQVPEPAVATLECTLLLDSCPWGHVGSIERSSGRFLLVRTDPVFGCFEGFSIPFLALLAIPPFPSTGPAFDAPPSKQMS